MMFGNYIPFDLTWWASSFCAVGMCLVAISAYRHPCHFLVRDPLFLPLYLAGIIQWVVWGIRINDSGLIIPSLLQILFLIPALKKWYTLRLL